MWNVGYLVALSAYVCECVFVQVWCLCAVLWTFHPNFIQLPQPASCVLRLNVQCTSKQLNAMGTTFTQPRFFDFSLGIPRNLPLFLRSSLIPLCLWHCCRSHSLDCLQVLILRTVFVELSAVWFCALLWATCICVCDHSACFLPCLALCFLAATNLKLLADCACRM